MTLPLCLKYTFCTMPRNADTLGVSITDPGIFPPADTFKDVGSLISTLLPNLLLGAGVVLFIIILVMGFKTVQGAGSGDAEAAAKGKRALTYAIAGFLIVFTSFWIIQLIEFIFGVEIFNPTELQ